MDTDATFMRMKDDHMNNGQLKAGYNVQISSEEQIITHYSIHQKSNDMNVLSTHLESQDSTLSEKIEKVCLDAGYGSEENYELLDTKQIDAYLPYPGMRAEEKKAYKNDISKYQNYFYNSESDFYVCPMGQRMYPKCERKKKTTHGFEQRITVYEAQNCNNCPLRGMCHKAKGNKQIEVNKNLIRIKKQIKEKLQSEEGKKIYKRRCIEPEPIFGNIKQNKKFVRFTLRGLEKVSLEFGLVAIGHNLQKLVKIIQNWFVFLIFEPIFQLYTKYSKKYKFIL